MAYENPKNILEGGKAAGNLSAAQYHFAKVDSNGRIDLNASAGGIVDGVLQDKADAVDKPCAMATAGVSIVKCGAQVAAGALVASDNQGRAVPAVSTNYAAGRALTATSNAGELLSVMLQPYGIVP